MSVLFDWMGVEGSNIQPPLTNEGEVDDGQLPPDCCGRNGSTGNPCVSMCMMDGEGQNAHFTRKVRTFF